MSSARWVGVTSCALLVGNGLLADDAIFDRLQERLTWSVLDDRLRVRLSGLLDVEVYRFEEPAPGLLFAEDSPLFNPRLTLYLDVQAGPMLYAFAQVRWDRGFDPSDGGGEVRIDEYALRFTPWEDGRFHVQVGQFGTVVGNWVKRHSSWDNAFITAPLAYETLTGVWDTEAVDSPLLLLKWAHLRPAFSTEYGDKDLRLPIIWGPSYATGAAISGRAGILEYAFEVKNGSLSSRPEYWPVHRVAWEHPTISGRVGVKPNEMWNVGLSASTGSYLVPSASSTVAPNTGLNDYRQEVLAADVSFAWHYWQIWAEAAASRWNIPGVGDADVFSWYVEAKYKFAPQLFGAVRVNRQAYGTIQESRGVWVRWGRNAWRVDLGPTYRFSPHTQLKLQYSWLHESDRREAVTHLVAAQMTVRF